MLTLQLIFAAHGKTIIHTIVYTCLFYNKLYAIMGNKGNRKDSKI